MARIKVFENVAWFASIVLPATYFVDQYTSLEKLYSEGWGFLIADAKRAMISLILRLLGLAIVDCVNDISLPSIPTTLSLR